jgi:hypothetical protein
MNPIPAITDADLPELFAALAEAERADRRTAARFVPPRLGILELAASRRHHFVLGRRGVGESTLLRKIAGSEQDAKRAVVFIDIETLRGRPYPDVLIEMLIELLTGLRERLAPDDWYRLDQRVRRFKVRRRLASLTATLKRLLAQPQVAERTVQELQSRASGLSVRGRLGGRWRGQGIEAGGQASRGRSSQETSEGTERLTKMDGLLSAGVLIREVLTDAQDAMGDVPTLIVLDDFYHVPFGDQPDVLAYLHQVVKNLDIFLKVCGVRHRLNPFVEGDPPRGPQGRPRGAQDGCVEGHAAADPLGGADAGRAPGPEPAHRGARVRVRDEDGEAAGTEKRAQGALRRAGASSHARGPADVPGAVRPRRERTPRGERARRLRPQPPPTP